MLIIASTGIAALQLPGGWTAHSMFKRPLNNIVGSGAACHVKGDSQRAELIRERDLITFDEICIMHKYCVEAHEITFRDLMGNAIIFGGKTIVMSGGWRQTSPIVQFGSAADSVEAFF